MEYPVKKNDSITIAIESYTAEGAGVGRYQGLAVFVPGTICGETVCVQIIKVAARYAVGKCVEILQPSVHRVEPPCPVYRQCGGCALQHMDASAQKDFKRQRIADCFAHIGGFEGLPLPIVHTMEHPFRYRNKASFPVRLQQGQTQLGLYAQRSHRIVPITDCLLQHQDNAAILQCVHEWMQRYHLMGYDEQTGRGTLRHVLTRRATNGDWLVCLVTTGPLPHTQALIDLLCKRIPQLKTVVENYNHQRTNVILGRRERVLHGDGTLHEQQLGLTFCVSAQSFLQVNPIQTQILYQRALCFAHLHGHETVVDAYCGVGTMSLLFAKKAAHVIGIECVAPAIDNAKQNAQDNGIDNVSFLCGYAEKELPKLIASGTKVDVLLLDPPRKGCDSAVLQAAVAEEISRIVYVSCNPSTLARDCAYLQSHGYKLEQLEGVDMFAQTAHVETVTLLIKTQMKGSCKVQREKGMLL